VGMGVLKGLLFSLLLALLSSLLRPFLRRLLIALLLMLLSIFWARGLTGALLDFCYVRWKTVLASWLPHPVGTPSKVT
jgi:hypothetical protein